MIKKYLTGAMIAAITVLGSASANADSIWFYNNGTQVGNSYEFTQGSVEVIATPANGNYTINQYNDFIFGYGLGVTSGFLDDTDVDGFGPDEAINLAFNQEVNVETLHFYYADSNDQFSVSVDNGVGSIYNINDISFFNGSYDFTLPGLLGTTFEIGATDWTDNFLLKGITYSVTAVPLPSAVLMFGAALIGLGWVKRRKQAA